MSTFHGNRLAGWLPPSLTDHEGMPLIVELAETIGCPPDGRGFSVALRRCIACIDAFGATRDLQDLKTYRGTLASFLDSIDRCSDTPPHVRAMPDVKAERGAYRLWLLDPIDHHAPEDARHVGQILGLVLLFHLSYERSIVDSRATSCIKLVKAGKRSDSWMAPWASFVETYSRDSVQLREQATSCSNQALRDLIDFLADSNASLISAPAPLTGRTDRRSATEPVSSANPAPAPGKQTKEAAPDDSSSKEEEPECLEEPAKGSLVRWQFARATRATGAQVTGLEDWNLLSPVELQQTTSRLAMYLDSPGHDDAPWAALAIISLLSALPVKHALELPLAPNNDVWVDLGSGCLCWSRLQLVKEAAVESHILDAGHRPGQILRVPLPLSVAGLLQSTATSNTSTLQRRLFGSVRRSEILRDYGSFLRSEPESGLAGGRKPYSARFAYSFGAAILHVTGNQILAGAISQDFRLLAPSEIDYLCISEKSIQRAIRKTYAFLGLGHPMPLASPYYFGSLFCPTTASMRAAITALHASSMLSAGLARPHMALPDFMDAFNRKVVADAAAAVLLTGHRGVMLQRWNCAAVYASREALLTFDKETAVSTVRILPKTKIIDNLLESHRRDLLAVATRVRVISQATALRIERIAEHKRPFASAFFRVTISTSSLNRIELRPIRSEDIAAALAPFGLARNAGRHYLLSHLVARNVLAPLVRVVSGHSRGRAQPFNSSAGIAPLRAIACLRPVIERIEKGAPKASWPGFRAQQIQAPPVVIVPKRRNIFQDSAVAAFNQRNKQLLGKRVDPFHKQSLSYYAFVQCARAQLLAGASNLSPWAAVLSVLCLVEGITSVETLENAWSAIYDEVLPPVGDTWLLSYPTPTGRLVAIPLQPITTIYVGAARRSKRTTFSHALADAMSWLGRLSPDVRWSQDPSAAIDELCGVAYSAVTLELPPWIKTAQCSSLDAATMSLESIARMVYGRPAKQARPIPRTKRRRVSTDRTDNSIAHVCMILNRFAGTDQPQGEEGARKKKLGDALANWFESAAKPSAGAEGLAEYINAERINTGKLGGELEVSSLATYVSSYRHFLETVEHQHPLDFETEQWRTGLELIGHGLQGDALERRRSIFRRFARFWLMRGAAVPPDVMEVKASEQAGPPPRRASSIFLSSRQSSKLLQYVSGEFESGSLLHAKALAYTKLAIAVPLRSGEFGPIRLADVDAETKRLTITTSGYSHIKSEQGRRTLPLGDELAAEFATLRERIRNVAADCYQFFLLANSLTARSDLDTIVGALVRGLTAITGESGARQHSLRGTSECYLICPGFDNLMGALAKGHLSALQTRKSVRDDWWCIARAANIAGHHPLSAIQFYVSIWPILAYDQRRHIHSAWLPGAGLESRIPGLSYDNLKQIRSRALRQPNAGQDIWSLLLARMGPLPGLDLGDLLVAPQPAPDDDNQTGEQKSNHQVTPAARVRFLGCRLAAMNFNTALDASGVTVAEGTRLDAFLSRALTAKVAVSSSVQSALKGSEGEAVARSISKAHDRLALERARDWIAVAQRCGPTPVAEVVSAAEALLRLLPAHLTVSILPENDQSIQDIRLRVISLARDILVKPCSKRGKDRCRFQVLPRDPERRGARAQGDMTALFDVLVSARILLRIMENESDDKRP